MYSTDSELSDWETRQFGKAGLKSPPLQNPGEQTSDSDDLLAGADPKMFDRASAAEYDSTDTENNKLSVFPSLRKNENETKTQENRTYANCPQEPREGSLFSAYSSMLTESSLDSLSHSEDSNHSGNTSPEHSVYGRYRKLDASQMGAVENLILHRLPGENLGMILGIEGGNSNGSVSGVFVKTVTIGGAAYRAQGSSRGICEGDEILEINGMDVKDMSYEECVSVLREMPLRVNLTIKRGETILSPLPAFGKSSLRLKVRRASTRELKGSDYEKLFQNYCITTSESEGDYKEGLEGFVFEAIEIHKDPQENLGISIVPSYGSTRHFYQVKRLLPSGVASRSGQICVGDRLVSCNGRSLCRLTQSECLTILKNEGLRGDLELEVLRQEEQVSPMEISINGSADIAGITNSQVTLKPPQFDDQHFYPTETETESDGDVILNDYQHHDSDFGGFVNGNLKTASRSPVQEKSKFRKLDLASDSNLSEVDTGEESDYSLRSQHLKLINSKMNTSPFEPSDGWGVALPPPAEFSDDQAFSNEVTESDGDVPASNIDEVLSKNKPAQDNKNTPSNTREFKDNELTPKETFSDATPNDKDDHLSAYIPSNTVSATINISGSATNKNSKDVMEKKSDYKSKVNATEPFQKTSSIQSTPSGSTMISLNTLKMDTNFSNVDTKTLNSEEPVQKSEYVSQFRVQPPPAFQSDESDDQVIVPVEIARKKTPSISWKILRTNSNDDENVRNNDFENIKEECIVPSWIEREKKEPIVTEDERKSLSPVPSPRGNVPKKPHPQPRRSKSKMSDSDDGVEENIVPAQHIKISTPFIPDKILNSKLEDDIVPEVAIRDTRWSNSVQLAMITNKWANMTKDKPKDPLKHFPKRSEEATSKSNDITQNNQNVTKIQVSMDLTKDDVDSVFESTEVREKHSPTSIAPVHVTKIDITENKNNSDGLTNVTAISSDTNSVKPVAKIQDKEEDKEGKINECNDVLGAEKKFLQESPVETSHEKSSASSHQVITTAQKSSNQLEQNSLNKPASDFNLSENKGKPQTSTLLSGRPSLLSTVRNQQQNNLSKMKPLSSIKPVKIDAKSLSKPAKVTSASSSKPSLLSTLHGSTLSDSVQNRRTEDGPFQISVLKGILGLGMKVKVNEFGLTQVQEIQSSGPIAKDGNIKVDDYILAINNTELIGLQDGKVQQILRLLPRGIAKITASPVPPSSTDVNDNDEKSHSEGSAEIISSVSENLPSSSLGQQNNRKGSAPVESRKLTPFLENRTEAVNSQQKVNQNSVVIKQPSDLGHAKVFHDQTAIQKEEASPARIEVPAIPKKPPPPIAPKPRMERMERTSASSDACSPPPKTSQKDYLTSAVEKNKTSPAVLDPEGPLNTVIFASVREKTDYITSAAQKKSPLKDQVPHMIPSGHVDYVDHGSKPKVAPKPTISPRGNKSKSPKLNAALSPRVSPGNKSPSQFLFPAKGTDTSQSEDKKVEDISSNKESDESLPPPVPTSPPPPPPNLDVEHDTASDVVCDDILDVQVSPNALDVVENLVLDTNVSATNEEIPSSQFPVEDDQPPSLDIKPPPPPPHTLQPGLDPSEMPEKPATEMLALFLEPLQDEFDAYPNSDVDEVIDEDIKEISQSKTDSVPESQYDKEEHEFESSGDSCPPPLPPMSTMPVALNIAQEMANDTFDADEIVMDPKESMTENKMQSISPPSPGSLEQISIAGLENSSHDHVSSAFAVQALEPALVHKNALESCTGIGNTNHNSFSSTCMLPLEPLSNECACLSSKSGVVTASVSKQPCDADISHSHSDSLNQQGLDGPQEVSVEKVAPVDGPVNSVNNSDEQHSQLIAEHPGPDTFSNKPIVDENILLDFMSPASQNIAEIEEKEISGNLDDFGISVLSLKDEGQTAEVQSLSSELSEEPPELPSVGPPLMTHDLPSNAALDLEKEQTAILLETADFKNENPVKSEIPVKPESKLILEVEVEQKELNEKKEEEVCKKVESKPNPKESLQKPAVPSVQADYSALEFPKPDNVSDDAQYEEFDVTMIKGVTGLGFLIEGGRNSPRGDVPLSIRRIFKGGPAEKCGQLKVKDQILVVNGEDLTHMRHSEAWHHLKFIEDGDVHLRIRRLIQPEDN